MRTLISGMLALAVLLLPLGAVAESGGKFYWRNVLAHHYDGAMGQALGVMTKFGLPQESAEKLLGRNAEVGTIARGEEYIAMVYGAHGERKVFKNVVMDWPNHALLATEDYWTEGFLVRRVVASNNWLLCKIVSHEAALTSAAAPAAVRPSSPATPPPAPATAPPSGASTGVTTQPLTPPVTATTSPQPAAGQGPNMVIAIFHDRENNFFRDRYLKEKRIEDRKTPYYRSVRTAGHAALKQELRARPFQSVSFLVTVRGGNGRILVAKTVATDERGEAFVPLPPLDQVRLVEVEVSPARRKDILPPETLYVQPEELARFNPLYVWFIQTQGLE